MTILGTALEFDSELKHFEDHVAVQIVRRSHGEDSEPLGETEPVVKSSPKFSIYLLKEQSSSGRYHLSVELQVSDLCYFLDCTDDPQVCHKTKYSYG